MQRCQSCGVELPEQASFCRNCGSIVRTPLDMQSDEQSKTFINKGSNPTLISDPLLPQVPSDIQKQQNAWEWQYEQGKTPGSPQTDENQPLFIDPAFPAGLPTPNSPPVGSAPMVHGTPQAGGVPIIHATPQGIGTPNVRGAPSAPPQTPAGSSGAPSAPPQTPAGSSGAPSAPPQAPAGQGFYHAPSASPQPEQVWYVQEQELPAQPPTHTSQDDVLRTRKHRSTSPQIIAAYLALPKNARFLFLLGLILLVLGGSVGVYALDESSEHGEDAVGFLRFEEPLERAVHEDISHPHAHAVATVTALVATASAIAQHHPFPQNGTTVLNDPLTHNTKRYHWVQGYWGGAGTNCIFTNGTYHVIESNTNRFYYCIAKNTNFSNFAFQVQMTFLQGDYGGVIFRSQGTKHYYFSIGRNNSYKLQLYTDDTGGNSRTLASGINRSIHNGLKQSNLIAIVARGNFIDLYINQHYITSVQDSTYSQGQIGLAAEDEGNPADVMFSNIKVWAV